MNVWNEKYSTCTSFSPILSPSSSPPPDPAALFDFPFFPILDLDPRFLSFWSMMCILFKFSKFKSNLLLAELETNFKIFTSFLLFVSILLLFWFSLLSFIKSVNKCSRNGKYRKERLYNNCSVSTNWFNRYINTPFKEGQKEEVEEVVEEGVIEVVLLSFANALSNSLCQSTLIQVWKIELIRSHREQVGERLRNEDLEAIQIRKISENTRKSETRKIYKNSSVEP